MSATTPKLYTLRRFAERHADAWTESSLRWLRFYHSTNGFKDAFLKVGGRVLIDEEKFFEAVRRVGTGK